jgi:hypothetical protein
MEGNVSKILPEFSGLAVLDIFNSNHDLKLPNLLSQTNAGTVTTGKPEELQTQLELYPCSVKISEMFLNT